MQKQKKSISLLPNSFKKIGLGISLLIILALPILLYFLKEKTNELLYLHESKWWLRTLTFDILILGLTLYALAKEKVEDECIMLLRLEAMAFAFLWSVMYVIIYPFTQYFVQQSFVEVNAYQVVLSSLGVYILMFTYKKKKM